MPVSRDTAGRGNRIDGAEFSGLYLARRKNGALLYAGKVEDGFSAEIVARLRVRLDPLVIPRQPVVTAAKPNAKWIEPIV